MGLDFVEIVLRAEETFAVDLPDDECEQVHTVGDLYRLVLQKLSLPYQPATETKAQNHGRDRSSIRRNPITPFAFTAPDVWVTLKAIIVDQLQVDPGDVQEEAGFQEDLGCD